MKNRFPNYQPSTALRQAIEALNASRKKRREAEGERQPDPPPGQSQGGPGAFASTPGREGTSIGNAPGLGQSHAVEGLGDKSDTDALTSGRHAPGLGENQTKTDEQD